MGRSAEVELSTYAGDRVADRRRTRQKSGIRIRMGFRRSQRLARRSADDRAPWWGDAE